MNIKRSTITFAVIGALVVIANSISALSSQPSFCGICHGKEYIAWQKSDHGKFNCNACHRRPDLASFAAQRIDVFRMVALYPITLVSRQPVTARVSNVACRSCHTDDTKTTTDKNIRMNHKAVDKGNYQCTDCHSTIAHGKAVPNPRFASMDKCVDCHVGKNPGSGCSTCHTKNVDPLDRTFKGPWQITHSQNWRKLHGMGNMKTCRICHSDDFCLRCHSVNMPHPDSWINTHGKVAIKSREGCLKCHQESLCKSCHQIDMPHGPNFLEIHPQEVGRLTTKVCFNCHQKIGCDRCHSQHIHPGIPQNKLKELRKALSNGSR